jgi:hypothetical protein
MLSRVRFLYKGIELIKNGNIPFERITPLPMNEISLRKRPDLSVRESLVIFQGNELNITVILGNGLLLVIVGGVLGAG